MNMNKTKSKHHHCIDRTEDRGNVPNLIAASAQHIDIVCFSNHDTSISNCYNLGTHKTEPKI